VAAARSVAAAVCGQVVALVGGQVVASGNQMNKVAAEAWRRTGSGLMYVNLVGGEDVVLRVRRGAQGRYDSDYTPPMPTVTASIRDVRGGERTEVTFIVDTAGKTLVKISWDAMSSTSSQ